MAIVRFIVMCILSLAIVSAAPPAMDQKNNRGKVDKHFLGGFPGMGYPGMGMGMGYPGMGMGYPGMGMGMGMGYPGMGMGGLYGGYPGYMGVGYPMGGYPGGGIMFYNNKGKGGNKTPTLQKP